MATTSYKQPTKVANNEVKAVPVRTLLSSNVSVGFLRSNDYAGTKTSGMKIRGTGAATKGIMSRGPMA